MLCLPGSDHSKELLAGEPELPEGVNQGRSPHDQMALWYVKAGFVAVAMDNPGVGELSDGMTSIDEFAQYLMWLGRSYESLAVFQKLPVLAWLKRQEYVDPRRIAVSGHSLGAKHALHLAILDPQIAAVVWNDGVVSWRERAVVMNLNAPFVNRQYLPGMLEWFDYPDLLASVAPRPLAICEGGRTRDLDKLKRAFDITQAEDRLRSKRFSNGTPNRRVAHTSAKNGGLLTLPVKGMGRRHAWNCGPDTRRDRSVDCLTCLAWQCMFIPRHIRQPVHEVQWTMAQNPDLVRGALEPVILEIIAAGTSYGYEIGRAVQEASGGELCRRGDALSRAAPTGETRLSVCDVEDLARGTQTQALSAHR